MAGLNLAWTNVKTFDAESHRISGDQERLGRPPGQSRGTFLHLFFNTAPGEYAHGDVFHGLSPFYCLRVSLSTLRQMKSPGSTAPTQNLAHSFLKFRCMVKEDCLALGLGPVFRDNKQQKDQGMHDEQRWDDRSHDEKRRSERTRIELHTRSLDNGDYEVSRAPDIRIFKQH